MAFIDNQLLKFKNMIEQSIVDGGTRGKESTIRSSALINLIHDAVKNEFINKGVNPNNIFPPFEETKPELKIAGFLKQKDQDVCIVPSNIKKNSTIITLNYSRNRIWTDNSTMNLKIAPYRHNITQLPRQKGIKSLWQSQEQLLNCQGSLIVAIPTVYLAY